MSHEGKEDRYSGRNLILIGVGVAALYWLIESALHVSLCRDADFLRQLFPTDPNELWMRSLIVVLIIAFGMYARRAVRERAQAEEEKEQLVEECEKALAEVERLSGFLPICSSCKRIRDDQGYWQQIEEYIRDHSDADFSHSICPDCLDLLYPELKKRN
jgi:hypothetical protein